MNGPMNGFDERNSKGFGCQDAFLAAAAQRQRSDDAVEEPRGTIGHGGAINGMMTERRRANSMNMTR